MKSCKKCGITTSAKKVTIDELGICNYCHYYEQYASFFENTELLRQKFLDIFKEKKGTYDVSLGLSGGKDSTYVLLKLINEYHLKVCTYTIDNGFLSPSAKKMIDKLVKDLNVPHVYITFNQDFIRKSYHDSLKKFLSPCIACSYIGYATMINATTKFDAKIGIHGRSRMQMFRNFDNNLDPFNELLFYSLKEEYHLEETYQRALEKIGKFVDKKVQETLQNDILKDAFEFGYRDFIPFFLYHEYDVDEIKKYLFEKGYDFYQNVEHDDCLIHKAADYLKNTFSINKYNEKELCYLVRTNKLLLEDLDLKKPKLIRPKAELNFLFKTAKVNNFILLKARIYRIIRSFK